MSWTNLNAICEDLVERVRSDAYLAHVYCEFEDKAFVAQEIKKLTAVLQGNGEFRPGIAIIWLGPSAMDSFPNVSLGPLDLRLTALVLEVPELNRRASGSGLAALTVARRLRDLCKHYAPAGLANGMAPADPFISSVDNPLAPVAYECRFTALESDDALIRRTPASIISENAGSVTLTIPSGSTVYFTTDGTYPRAGNASAQVYAAPFAVTAGNIVHAAAYLDGEIPSFVTRLKIT